MRNTISSTGWETDNHMSIVDVKSDEFALIHTVKTKAGSSTVLDKLYGNSINTPSH